MIIGYLSRSEEINEEQRNNLSSYLNKIANNNHVIESFEKKSLLLFKISHKSLLELNRDQYFFKNDIVVALSGVPTLLSSNNEKLNASKIIDLYREKGINFTNILSGQFAITIIDFDKGLSYLIKDHTGTVPITYSKLKDGILFGPEVGKVATHFFKEDSVDKDYLKGVFLTYSENYSKTPNSKIKRVLPGTYIRIENCHATEYKYWFPENIRIDKSIDFEKAVATLSDLVVTNIDSRLTSSGQVGSHLSGGLESSFLASLTRSKLKNQSQFHGFSWSPKPNQLNQVEDEREIVLKQAEKYNISPVFTELNTDDYLSYLTNWSQKSHFPFEQLVQKEAAERNINVLFSGFGGDEFIGLPDFAIALDLFKKKKFGLYRKLNPSTSIKSKLKFHLNSIISPLRRKPFFLYRTSQRLNKYLNLNSNLQNNRSILNSKNDYIVGLLKYHHIAERCESWYIMGQENGIEYQYPLLDKSIIEYSLKMDTSLFALGKHNKPIVRSIAKPYVIDEIYSDSQRLDPALYKHLEEVEHDSIHKMLHILNTSDCSQIEQFFNIEAFKESLHGINLDDSSQTKDVRNILSYLVTALSITNSL
jgi:asparagine synthase (glutamine-hydrolysing)